MLQKLGGADSEWELAAELGAGCSVSVWVLVTGECLLPKTSTLG